MPTHDQTKKEVPLPVQLAEQALALLREENPTLAQEIEGRLTGYAVQSHRAGQLLSVADLLEAARKGPSFLKKLSTAPRPEDRRQKETYRDIVDALTEVVKTYDSVSDAEEKMVLAASKGDFEYFSQLRMEILERSSFKESSKLQNAFQDCLRSAIYFGHLDFLKKVLDNKLLYLSTQDALYYAVKSGRAEMVSFFIEKRGDEITLSNLQDEIFCSDLINLEFLKFLLQYEKEKREKVDKALDDPAFYDRLLRHAAYFCALPIIEYIVSQNKCSTNAINEALEIALERNTSYEVASYLHAKGGRISAEKIAACMEGAIKRGDLNVIKYLHRNGFDFLELNATIFLPMICNLRNAKVLQYLLENGFEVSAGAKEEFFYKQTIKNLEMIWLLLDNGKDVNSIADERVRETLKSYILERRTWMALTSEVPPRGLQRRIPLYFNKAMFEAAMECLSQDCIDDDEIMANRIAFEVSGLFETNEQMLAYIKKWGARLVNKDQPIFHAITYMIKFPVKGEFNLKDWRSAIMTCGPGMAGLLKFADKLPSPLKNKAGSSWSLQETRAEVAKFCFNRAAENPALAALCLAHQVEEQHFEQALEIVQKRTPTTKNIPAIIIDGSQFNMQGGRFYRLPANDIRGLFLGEATDCCQSISGVGAECAEHGYTSEDGGFYVVENSKGRIVAQSWAWRGHEKEMCFDTLETLGNNVTDDQWARILTLVADDLDARKDHDVMAFRVGAGGKTPERLQDIFRRAQHPAAPKNYNGYWEGRTQLEVWSRKLSL